MKKINRFFKVVGIQASIAIMFMTIGLSTSINYVAHFNTIQLLVLSSVIMAYLYLMTYIVRNRNIAAKN